MFLWLEPASLVPDSDFSSVRTQLFIYEWDIHKKVEKKVLVQLRLEYRLPGSIWMTGFALGPLQDE